MVSAHRRMFKKYNPGFTHPCIIMGDAWDKR